MDNQDCKPLLGEFDVQNIEHGPAYRASFALYITLGVTGTTSMALMSAEEQLAQDLSLSVSKARHLVQDFGYRPNETETVQSHAIGMFIVWLTSMEEGRHMSQGNYRSFSDAVIDRLPALDDFTWPSYILPGPVAPLRKRAEALWGIRIAITHGGGDISRIKNAQNRSYAESAPTAIPGVVLIGTVLQLSGCNLHTPIRTMQQLRETLR